MTRILGWLAAAVAAVAAVIVWLTGNGDDDGDKRAAAQATEREDIADNLAAERLAIQQRRERDMEVIQDDLDTKLLQVETDLPGAMADALHDARGGGDDSAA